MINLAILISGRGTNMNAILKSYKNGKLANIRKVVVISNNENAPGLKIASEVYNVKTETISKLYQSRQEFERNLMYILQTNNINPEEGLICLAGFMKILTPPVINTYNNKIMNIHPSLLPSFKGLNAQKQALEAGVKITGCTVHFVNKEVDSGPIILQRCVPVYDNDNENSLSERILEKEHDIYVEAINLFANDKLILKENKVVIKE